MAKRKIAAISETTYNSDEEPPEEDLLIWRLDPTESLSDWKLEIVRQEVAEHDCLKVYTKIDTYHVHKAILAAGPRSSQYFARLFRQNGFSEAQTGTSRIELHTLAAEVVPELLDYIYAGHTAVQISTQNATALHWLGRYFDIRRLKWDLQQFVNEDMSVVNCGTYYEHAWFLQEEKILEFSEKMCRENILQIKTSSRLLNVPNTDFWIELLENAYITNRFSSHISTLIAELCDNLDIDAGTFQKLTEERVMPVVHFGSALKLIETERTLVQPNSDCLSSLQERCVKAWYTQWRDVDISGKAVSSMLAKQNPLLLTKILKKTSTELYSSEASRNVLSEDRDELERMLSSAEKQIRSEKATFQYELNSLTAKWQTEKAALQNEISYLKEEKRSEKAALEREMALIKDKNRWLEHVVDGVPRKYFPHEERRVVRPRLARR